MPAATLAFSITAHERIDVLRGQVLNILHFCAAPTIIVHVSAAFRASLDADPASLAMFRRIATLPGVIVNPAHLPTRWAHMFHAHVANFHHLEEIGATYSHLVLCSSADLFFRCGVEGHVAQFDAGFDRGNHFTRDSLSHGYWDRSVKEDEILWRMLAACGSETCRKSMHEGSFYRRDLLLGALAVMDAHVSDWEYDDRYPKEEFFLPSLVHAMAPDIRTAPRLSHLLGLGDTWGVDRLAVRHALLALGAESKRRGPLADWLTNSDLESQTPPPDLQSRFMLARLVRRTADPLRNLMIRLAETLPAADRVELCDGIDGYELLAFDLPGRRVSSEPAVISAAATQPLLERNSDHLLDGLDATLPASTREFGPCPISYLPPEAVWPNLELPRATGRMQSCAAWVPVAGVRLTLGAEDRALTLAIEAPDEAAEPRPGQRTPEVFIFWPVPVLDPCKHRALRLRIDGTASMLARVSLWLEYHVQDKKRHLNLGNSLIMKDHENQSERVWLLRQSEIRRVVDDLGPGQFNIYFAVPPIAGGISIRHVLAIR